MKSYAIALVVMTTLSCLVTHAGVMDLPVDGSEATPSSSKASTQPQRSVSQDGFQKLSSSQAAAVIQAFADLIGGDDGDSLFKCTSSDKDGAVTASDNQKLSGYGTNFSMATSVFRREGGQPALKFIVPSGDSNYDTLITTDSTGKRIKKMDVSVYGKVSAKTENVGSLVNPHFVDIPTHMDVTDRTVCIAIE